MTTAFELGCLSAMEKVAAEPNTASNYGDALQAAQKKINIIGNNPDTKMYDAPYWNSFGARAHNNLVGGLASIRDAAIGTGNFIGNAASTGYDYATVPGRALGDTLGSLMYPDKSPPPTKAPKPLPYGIKDEAPRPYGPAGQSNKNSDLISPAFTAKDLADSRLALVQRQIAIHDAAAQKRITALEAERLGSPLLTPDERRAAQFKKITPARMAEVNAKYGQPQPKPESEPAPEPKSETKLESKPEPKSEPKPTEQGGLMSYLKNPYVLGGLGIGALGLGGYGLYNHFNPKKKKKKESDSE